MTAWTRQGIGVPPSSTVVLRIRHDCNGLMAVVLDTPNGRVVETARRFHFTRAIRPGGW